jgi:hypothetical protein
LPIRPRVGPVVDAVWVALRFQIPVIPVFAPDRWEPALDGLQLPIPFTDTVIEFDTFTPEDHAYFLFSFAG